MFNIDISEVFCKNKQIDVSIKIVFVRCLTNQRAEKTIPTTLKVCTAIDNRTHLQNICHKLRRLVLAETVVWSDWTEGKIGPGKKWFSCLC